MNRITTLVLLLLVAALGIFFFYKKENPPPPANPSLLAGFNPNAVSEIFFESIDRGIRANFRRVPGGWEMIQPFHYPAETSTLDAFLSPLEHNSCTLVADLALRPDLSLEPYGLTKPRAVIRIRQGGPQDGKDRELRLGSESLGGDQIFVLAENKLLQTSRNLLNATQRNLEEMRTRETFRIPYEAVREFEVWKGGDSMKFRNSEGLWQIESPWKEPADSAQVASFLAALVGIRVEKFLDDHPGVDSSYGLDPAMYRVILRDGKREDELRLGRSPTTGDFVARRMDFPFVWLVKPDVEQFFQQSASEFRNRIFFRAFRDQIEEVRLLNAAGEMALVRKDGAWRMAAPREWRLDRNAVEDLLDQLQRLQVADFPALGSQTLADVGLDTPALSVQVKAARENPVRVIFGKRDAAGKRFARRDGTQAALLVEESSVPFLATSLFDYLDPVLLSFAEEGLKRIEIVRREPQSAETKLAWTRDAAGRWRRLGAEGAPEEKEDRKLVDSMDRFLFWKGKKALQEISDPAALGTPWMEIRYFDGNADESGMPSAVAPIWKLESSRIVTRGSVPVAWELDSKIVEMLLGLF